MEYITDSSTTRSIPSLAVPYGILSIDTYVKSKTEIPIHSNILDLNEIIISEMDQAINIIDNLETILETMIEDEEKINIFAISALFNTNYSYLEVISKTVKRHTQDALCLIGGGLATNIPRRITRDFPDIDGVCYSEGEIPFLNLIRSIDRGTNPITHMTKSVSWYTQYSTKDKRLVPQLIDDLDEIPILDYSLIDLSKYSKRSVNKIERGQRTGNEITIHTSRGCPYNCIYCANGSVHGKKVRYMSTERVISDISTLSKRHNADVVMIEDDHFLSDSNRAIEILTELSRKEISIEYPNGIAVKQLNRKMVDALHKSGVKEVQLAVESCSDRVLKNIINKPHTLHDIKTAVSLLREKDIRIHAYIVIGIPGETDKDRKESLDNIIEIGFDWVYYFIATPVVGSRLYNICIEHGYIDPNDMFSNHTVNRGCITAPGISPNDIEKIQYFMNLETNFVRNHNMRTGNTDLAMRYFKDITDRYPDHAMAFYFYAKCLELSPGSNGSASKYMTIARDIISSSLEWTSYFDKFNIEV